MGFDKQETDKHGEKKQRHECSAMMWIGKGLATVAVWVGSCILGLLGIVFLVGPLFGLIAGVIGTMAIWCPQQLKNL